MLHLHPDGCGVSTLAAYKPVLCKPQGTRPVVFGLCASSEPSGALIMEEALEVMLLGAVWRHFPRL